jgi:hypothetical protein
MSGFSYREVKQLLSPHERLLGDIKCLSSSELVLSEQLDDINGDGSVYVPFIRVIKIGQDGTNTVVGNFLPDLITPYTIIGPVVSPNDPAVVPEIKWETVELSGAGTWSPTSLIRSASYYVQTVGDTGNPPTIAGSTTAARDLREGESGTFGIDLEKSLTNTAPVITTFINDIVVINYTSL